MTLMMHKINNYNFKSSNKLLLDTNIWLFIYGPQKPKDQKVEIYSNAFSRILSAKSKIFIDMFIISEFINAYSRIKYKLAGLNNFKEFRRSSAFKLIAKEISDNVKRILKECSLVNGYEKLVIANLIETYAEGNFDFNDQVLTEICKNENLILITDDADFINQEISIITGNNRLLARKK